MTRRITLPLGESTTETHCGNCMHLNYYNPTDCEVFGLLVASDLRSHSCRAAEVKEVDDAE